MRTRVHLLKSEEVDKAAYPEILQQLQSFSGPLEFVSTVDEPVFEDDESTSFDTDQKDIRDTSLPLPEELIEKRPMYSMKKQIVSEMARFIEAPEKLTRLKWDDIFESCRAFRKANDISEFEFVKYEILRKETEPAEVQVTDEE